MVLHPITATRISSAALREIRARVFRRREATLIEEASRYNIHDYEVTVLSTRRDIRLLLETLPAAAFEAQPTTDIPIWSAGEVIAHVRHAQMNIFLRGTRLAAGLPAGRAAERPDDAGTHPICERAAALAILDDADLDLIEVFDSLTAESDTDSTTQDDLLGEVTVRSTLLFLAIHEDDHLGQLRELLDAHAG